MSPEQKRNPLAAHDQCAQEQIHLIGHIQSHGMLFALSLPDLIVRHVSANVSELLGLAPEAILGQSFLQLIGAQKFAELQSSVSDYEAFIMIPVPLSMRGGTSELPCVVHRQGDMLIAELELTAETAVRTERDIDTHVRLPLLHLERAHDIEELSQVAAEEIRKLSGFARIMIYRFDEDWNGEVIAEVSTSSVISYQGLLFPATDIPPQARQLFLVNPLRTIADVTTAAVPIISDIDPLSGRPLDLTRSVLRSASQVHLEYLRNMEVQSSMTVSVIVDGKLWGLIACHDARPHRVDRSTRSIAMLIGQNFASQVALRIDNAALQLRVASRESLEHCVTAMEATDAPLETQLHSRELLDLFNADGLVSNIDGVIAGSGVTVEYDSLHPVISSFRTQATRGVSSSHALGRMAASQAFNTQQCSGALYIELDGSSGDHLVFLRRERVETVTWAGNPHEAVSVDAQHGLHPRTSFAAWSESVRGLSRPWTEIELVNASYLREQLLRLRGARLLGVANKALTREMADRKRAEADLLMAQKLESVGRLAAGVAHEINTPVQFVADNVQFVRTSMTELAPMIQACRALQQAVRSAGDVAAATRAAVAATAADHDYIVENLPLALNDAIDGLERIATIVRSMKEFAHPDQAQKAPADLNRAIEGTLVIANNEYKHVAQLDTDFGELPLVQCYLGEINQVVLNLVVNAAHAMSAVVEDTGQRGTLTVRTRREGDDVEISIGDTGTGIPEAVRDRVFDPFFTTKDIGKGTGQGLAIAHRVVVDQHGGSLRFETQCGKGTTFFVRLPIGASGGQHRK